MATDTTGASGGVGHSSLRLWHGLIQRNFGYAWVVGIAMAVATVVFAVIKELPILDPDSLIPGYIRFPLIVFAGIALDIVPRVLWRARFRPRDYRARWREVIYERWPKSHWLFAIGGVSAWYLTYAAFRNLKSMAPFINKHSWDDTFSRIDRKLWFGHDPHEVLQSALGTGWAAHFFSSVYFVWIALVPISIAIALVWTRNTQASSWYVTAVAFDWALGALFYILLPTVGPVYLAANEDDFARLPHTYNTELADSLWRDHLAVLSDPFNSTLQTIAAFPSLHVGIMVTICLTVELVGLQRWIRITSWVFLVFTMLATLYLGWHFFVDVLGGVALGSVSVWAAALATGNNIGLRPKLDSSAPLSIRRERVSAPAE